MQQVDIVGIVIALIAVFLAVKAARFVIRIAALALVVLGLYLWFGPA